MFTNCASYISKAVIRAIAHVNLTQSTTTERCCTVGSSLRIDGGAGARYSKRIFMDGLPPSPSLVAVCTPQIASAVAEISQRRATAILGLIIGIAIFNTLSFSSLIGDRVSRRIHWGAAHSNAIDTLNADNGEGYINPIANDQGGARYSDDIGNIYDDINARIHNQLAEDVPGDTSAGMAETDGVPTVLDASLVMSHQRKKPLRRSGVTTIARMQGAEHEKPTVLQESVAQLAYVLQPPQFTAFSSVVVPDAAAAATPHGQRVSLIASDIFLSGPCVRFVSVPECGLMLDWRLLLITVHSAHPASACSESATDSVTPEYPCSGPALFSRPSGRFARLKVRTMWEWTTTGELCSSALANADYSDIELTYLDARFRVTLSRTDARRGADFAIVATAAPQELHLVPLWLSYWSTLGVGHFYIYVTGIVASAAAAPLAAIAGDARVTIVQWDHPAWQHGRYTEPGKTCAGHFATPMALNSALLRYGASHRFLGHFNVDEFLIVSERQPPNDSSGLTVAPSPLMDIARQWKFPSALLFATRWAVIASPAVSVVRPFTAIDFIAAGYVVYGAHFEQKKRLGRYFVRTYNTSRDAILGVYSVVHLPLDSQLSSGVKVGEPLASNSFVGTGYEQHYVGVALSVKRAYSTRIFNLGPSGGVPFDLAATAASAIANNSIIREFSDVVKRNSI